MVIDGESSINSPVILGGWRAYDGGGNALGSFLFTLTDGQIFTEAGWGCPLLLPLSTPSKRALLTAIIFSNYLLIFKSLNNALLLWNFSTTMHTQVQWLLSESWLHTEEKQEWISCFWFCMSGNQKFPLHPFPVLHLRKLEIATST